MPLGQMRNFVKELSVVRQKMDELNYRPVTIEDIVAGAEVIMVDVLRFSVYGRSMEKFGQAGTTVIKLLDPPTRVHKLLHETTMVYYTCVGTNENVEIFVPMEEFLRDGYTPKGNYSSDTRYFVKKEVA